MPQTARSEEPDNARIVLGLLEFVERDGAQSQRKLASDLGIALGLVNAYLKRCVKKGLLKIGQAPPRRYAYYLTPHGFAEKSRLTVEYLSSSFSFFRRAREDCSSVLKAAHARGWNRIALIGVSDLAEIATICALEQGITIVAVVDAKCKTRPLRRHAGRDIDRGGAGRFRRAGRDRSSGDARIGARPSLDAARGRSRLGAGAAWDSPRSSNGERGMTAELHPRWFVAHTHPHAEAKATSHLNRQGFEIYFPRYLKRRRHARRIETVAAPLFPRYLFVAVDLDGAALALDLFDRRRQPARLQRRRSDRGARRHRRGAEKPRGRRTASSSWIIGRHFAPATRFACSMARSRPASACSRAWRSASGSRSCSIFWAARFAWCWTPI